MNISVWYFGFMKFNPYIFRNYDIRGVAGVDLNPKKVEIIGRAYGTFLQRRKIRQAVVGRDCRLSGKAYATALIKGLTAGGVDVIDLGIVMTQMVYFGQYYFQVNGAAMITASHNPAKFNGFKFATGYSRTTETEDVQEIRTIAERERFFIPDRQATVKVLGARERATFSRDYTKDILKRVSIRRRYKVVVDTGAGTVGSFVPSILRQLGCTVIGLNLKPDGRFPVGTPDPTATEMMHRVREAVLAHHADFGIAFDGDGDRIGLVDERGNILWNDVLVAIFAKEILERFPHSKIVHNTLCSQLTSKVIKQNGGVPIMWRTGHAFIKQKIVEEDAAFGGELSGHFFFADNAYGHDDGTYALARILDYLSSKNKSLSALYAEFPKYISSPEIKIGCPDDKKVEVIRSLSTTFKKDFPRAKIIDGSVIPGDDGTRADFKDGMIIFRYSQNGPYVTIKFEARDEKTYNERKRYVKALLEQYPEMIWKDELAINLSSLD